MIHFYRFHYEYHKYSQSHVLYSVGNKLAPIVPIVSGWVNDQTCRILIDSGATVSIIASQFVQKHKLVTAGASKVIFEMADGTRSQSAAKCDVAVKIGEYHQNMELRLCPLAQRADVILGMDWLQTENPQINWTTGEVRVGSVVLCMGRAQGKQPEVQAEARI